MRMRNCEPTRLFTVILFAVSGFCATSALAGGQCLQIVQEPVNHMGSRASGIKATHRTFSVRDRTSGRTIRHIGSGRYNACEINYVTSDLKYRLENLEEGKRMLTPALQMSSALLTLVGSTQGMLHHPVAAQYLDGLTSYPTAVIDFALRHSTPEMRAVGHFHAGPIFSLIEALNDPAATRYQRPIERKQTQIKALQDSATSCMADREVLKVAESLGKALARAPATLKTCDPKKAGDYRIDHPTLRESLVKNVPGLQDASKVAKNASRKVTEAEDTAIRKARSIR